MGEEYSERLQVMVSPEFLERINKIRGDVPLSIFLRKKLESVLS